MCIDVLYIYYLQENALTCCIKLPCAGLPVMPFTPEPIIPVQLFSNYFVYADVV